jgi:hypothetical protein
MEPTKESGIVRQRIEHVSGGIRVSIEMLGFRPLPPEAIKAIKEAMVQFVAEDVGNAVLDADVAEYVIVPTR